MFLPELDERRHGNIKFVVAIMVVYTGDFRGGSQTMSMLEVLNGWFGLRVEHVRQRSKAPRLGVEQKTAFLEKHRNGFLPASTVVDQGAYLCRTRIGNRYNLDETGRIDRVGFGRSEDGIDVDTPLCHQPQ